MEWFHVTPLFLLPRILTSGGLRCGADLALAASPRRQSSRDDDDKMVAELEGQRPSDCVLLFRKKSSELLDHKLRGHRESGRAWKAYPHLRLDFSAEACLRVAGWQIYGSRNNVGRTLKKGGQPHVEIYRSVAAVQAAKVEEIMVPASSLDHQGRCLPLNALRRIVAFSCADLDLVREHLARVGQLLTVTMEEKAQYAASQVDGPGKTFLHLTRELYRATWDGDSERQAALLLRLARECFD